MEDATETKLLFGYPEIVMLGAPLAVKVTEVLAHRAFDKPLNAIVGVVPEPVTHIAAVEDPQLLFPVTV